MLKLSYFPLIWKLSRIILIRNLKKSKTLTTSKRLISVLSTIAKLFEKIMLKKIKPPLQIHNTISKSQFCFREKHSTMHTIHRLTDQISSSFKMLQFCADIFLDEVLIFDLMWLE